MLDDILRAIKIFYCYARRDQRHRDKLEKHLAILSRLGYIIEWYDHKIVPGTQWEEEIGYHLDTAHIILLLVSPDFISSDYCYGIEMARALERHDAGEAYVIPIIIRPVVWQGTPIDKLQILPTDAKAVTEWRNHDSAYEDVVQGIRRVVQMINSSKREEEHSQRGESHTFSFGNQATSWLVVDGDGECEYTPRTIFTYFAPYVDELPEDLAERKNQVQKQQDENHLEGLPFRWNGERYSLDRFRIGRDGLEEYISLELWFKLSDYYTFLATNMGLDEEALRSKYLQGADWHSPIKFFSNSFGTSLAVITKDLYLIITQRSTSVGSRSSEYNISVNEGLSRSLDRSIQGHAPDVYRCASRGLSEELGLSEHHDFKPYDIVFLSFGVDTHYAQWGLLGMVKVNKTAEDIRQWRTAGVKDKWENSNLHFVKFDLDSVIPFVLSHGPWAPSGLACLYHTLVHEFKRHKIEQAIKKYSK